MTESAQEEEEDEEQVRVSCSHVDAACADFGFFRKHLRKTAMRKGCPKGAPPAELWKLLFFKTPTVPKAPTAGLDWVPTELGGVG